MCAHEHAAVVFGVCYAFEINGPYAEVARAS